MEGAEGAEVSQEVPREEASKTEEASNPYLTGGDAERCSSGEEASSLREADAR